VGDQEVGESLAVEVEVEELRVVKGEEVAVGVMRG
jgi:hypothetical protein